MVQEYLLSSKKQELNCLQQKLCMFKAVFRASKKITTDPLLVLRHWDKMTDYMYHTSCLCDLKVDIPTPCIPSTPYKALFPPFSITCFKL